MIAIDTETALASNEHPIPDLVSIAVFDGARLDLVHRDDPAAPRIAEHAYTQGAVLCNAPFDAYVIGRAWPDLWPVMRAAYLRGIVADVATREKLIDIAVGAPAGRYNLGAIAESRAGITLDKDDPWRLRYAELRHVPISQWPAEAVRYAQLDAVATWYVWQRQEEEHADLFQHAPDLARKHLELWGETLRGLVTDQAQVAAVDQRLTAQITMAAAIALTHGLADVGGTKAEPVLVAKKKPAQAAVLAHCQATGQTPATTATGAVSVSHDALERLHVTSPECPACRGDGCAACGQFGQLLHPLEAYRQFKAVRAQRSKNLPVFQRPLIRTRYDECKDTGRTGSSAPQGKKVIEDLEPWEWVGTNLQNLPRVGGWRECIVARPGHKFVIQDFTGLELVTNAQNQLDVLGVSPLADVIRSGKNPHTMFACTLLGIRYEDYDPQNPTHKDRRQLAKPWNFGKWGAMGDPKFQGILRKDYGIHMPIGEIKQYTRDWKRQWDADRYFRWVESNPSTPKMLPDGRTMPVYRMRHQRTGFVRGGCSYTEACNFPFQHLGAAVAGLALWWTWCASQDPDSPLYAHGAPTSGVLFAHDELVCEVPTAKADAALAALAEIMIQALRYYCPDVPGGVDGPGIVDRYCK